MPQHRFFHRLHPILKLRLRTAVVTTVFGCCLVLGCGDDQATNPTQRFSENGGDTFLVGDTISLRVDGFAGGVEIRPASQGSVKVNFTKWAAQKVDLAKIIVSMTQLNNEIDVFTSKPPGLNQTSVDLEIYTPPGCEPVIRLGAGSIRSFIRPNRDYRLQVGAGNILLELPGDIGVTVHLSTGVGTISVEFPVHGNVSPRVVEGTIGAGDEAEIWVQTGAGNIQIKRGTE